MAPDPNELEMLRQLSEQHGVPGIDLLQAAIPLEHLDLIPRDVAESHLMVPVLVRGDKLFLAVSTPSNKRSIDEVEFVTGKKVYPYVAVPRTLQRTIAAAYDAKARGERYYLGPNVPAQVLKQLGLTPPEAGTAGFPPQEHPSRAFEPAPGAPGVVSDEAVRQSDVDISFADFGNIGSDVSSIAMLPPELRAPAKSQSSSPSPQRAEGQKLILVVDDEEDIRKLLNRMLADKGYRVIEADRGQLALRMVKEYVPDLIVLDAMLPELHGFDIARRIKGSEKYGAIPIIMVSAIYRGWRIAEDLKASYGIDEYFEKPFRVVDLLAAIRRILATRTEAGQAPGKRDPEALSGDAERALNEGIEAYRQGKLDQAIEHLKRGIAIDPLAYRLHYHMALLLGKKGLLYEGIGELEKAIDLNPKHFPALKNLAVLYEKAGFKHKAIELWERCVQNAPDVETRASIKEHLLKIL